MLLTASLSLLLSWKSCFCTVLFYGRSGISHQMFVVDMWSVHRTEPTPLLWLCFWILLVQWGQELCQLRRLGLPSQWRNRRRHNPHTPLPNLMPAAISVTILQIYLGLGLAQGSAGYSPSDLVDPHGNSDLTMTMILLDIVVQRLDRYMHRQKQLKHRKEIFFSSCGYAG